MVAAGRLQLPRRRQADCLTRKGNGETRRRSAGLTGVPEPVLATSIRSRTAGSQLLLRTMEAVTWSTIPARRQCASHWLTTRGIASWRRPRLARWPRRWRAAWTLDGERESRERKRAVMHGRAIMSRTSTPARRDGNNAQEGLARSWSSTTSSTCTWRSTSSLAADGSSWALVGQMHQRSDARKSKEAVHWWPRPGSSAGRATATGSSMKVRDERFGLIASRSWSCS